jgi:hypothetical protein
MRIVVIAMGLVGCIGAIPARGYGWGEVGHMTVAKLAWPQLDKSQRKSAYETLQQLPHLKRFLAEHPRPDGVGEEEWLFLIAADWPDWVKGFKTAAKKGDKDGMEIFKDHIENWHFFDIPFEFDFTGKVPKAKDRDIVKALTNDLPTWHKDINAAQRAKALCWLLHLVGDIHQPLHCTTMFTDDFPRGDTGGNNQFARFQGASIELHGFWDNLPGHFTRMPDKVARYYEKVLDKVSENATILSRHDFGRATFAVQLKKVDPMDWARDSHDLGVKVAYRNGKLSTVYIDHNTEPHEASEMKHNAPPLPDDYHGKALATANRQLALAGYRLADRIDAIFPKNGGNNGK